MVARKATKAQRKKRFHTTLSFFTASRLCAKYLSRKGWRQSRQNYDARKDTKAQRKKRFHIIRFFLTASPPKLCCTQRRKGAKKEVYSFSPGFPLRLCAFARYINPVRDCGEAAG
jgi:hypothetical protein